MEKAYKRVALIVHPDKNPKANKLATKLFQMVADIYQTLKNGPDQNIGRTQNLNPFDLFNSFFGNNDPFACFNQPDNDHFDFFNQIPGSEPYEPQGNNDTQSGCTVQ